MKAYVELMAQFYDEFPDAMGIVTFRHGFYDDKYPDIFGHWRNQLRINLLHGRNIALCNTDGFSITIGTNGAPAFTKSILGLFNRSGHCVLGPVEQAFIFHHETHHAIRFMERGYFPSDFVEKHKDEANADAYATLRVLSEYGLDSLPFLQIASDWRIKHCHDLVHLTTFSIDNAMMLYLGLEKVGIDSRNLSGRDFILLADQLVANDPMHNLINLNPEFGLSNWRMWARRLTMGNIFSSHYPEWFVTRYDQAIDTQRSLDSIRWGKDDTVNVFPVSRTNEIKPVIR